MPLRTSRTRRSAAVFLSLALVGWGAAACSSDPDSGAADNSVAASSASLAQSASADGDAAAYPVTVATKFGDVTVEEAPRRVVALGWGGAEVALSLGVQPDLILILDVRSSGDRERYDALSAIAPVVGIPEGADNWLTDRSTQLEWWGETAESVPSVLSSVTQPASARARESAARTGSSRCVIMVGSLDVMDLEFLQGGEYPLPK
ncbi:hypothetical protein [Corynebacterium sp. HMSC056F09]|uniref:hypothetical protein n=1 Tax=Corynebacterium sp. HMSC056F09 TaxID=1739548 RepID=UPI001FEE1C4D|nr:hypothetical protein [Corynebacterium sp. HMSC056F09]